MHAHVDSIAPDFAFYTERYHGTMSEQQFVVSIEDATAEVAYALYERANLEPVADRVRMAICAVADAVGNPERRAQTSYKAGDVSESFSDPGFSLTAEAAIKRWLGGTGVLKWGQWL